MRCFTSLIIIALISAGPLSITGKAVLKGSKATNYTQAYNRLSDLLIGAYLWPHPVRPFVRTSEVPPMHGACLC